MMTCRWVFLVMELRKTEFCFSYNLYYVKWAHHTRLCFVLYFLAYASPFTVYRSLTGSVKACYEKILCVYWATKTIAMSDYHNQLQKLLENYPDSQSVLNITKLENIASSYESILNAVREESDDVKRNTTFHGSELIDIERKLSTARYGKTKNAKREAFNEACKKLRDDIEDLARKVQSYLP